MSTVLLPIIPETLTPGVCYANEQQRLNAFAGAMQAQLDGMAFYNYGDTKPDPENQDFPWLRTTDMRWYKFDSMWISPHPLVPSSKFRWLYFGTEAQLNLEDGGDNLAPGINSGPMWLIDHTFDSRFPIAPGTLPSGTIVPVAGTGGEEEHQLLQNELPAVLTGMTQITNEFDNEGTFQETGIRRLLSSTMSRDGAPVNALLPDIQTFGGNPMNNLPPYIGIYFAQRSNRLNYSIP